jgi:hypothetical protein
MIWKKIEGYDYSINEIGEVRNNKTGRILKQGLDKDGYYKVNLFDGTKGKIHYIHRLLGIYFLSCRPHMQVDHIDRDKKNNNLCNLRVVTHQHNQWNTNAKGYTWNKKDGMYHAKICVNKKDTHLGSYATEELARAAYLRAKEIYHVVPAKPQ